jgi:hypothetical protein
LKADGRRMTVRRTVRRTVRLGGQRTIDGRRTKDVGRSTTTVS